jgi:hypothetical protein
MTEGGEFEAMSDPEFLAERRRVREALQILTERYREINQEFDRRAQTAWDTSGQRGGSKKHSGADQPRLPSSPCELAVSASLDCRGEEVADGDAEPTRATLWATAIRQRAWTLASGAESDARTDARTDADSSAESDGCTALMVPRRCRAAEAVSWRSLRPARFPPARPPARAGREGDSEEGHQARGQLGRPHVVEVGDGVRDAGTEDDHDHRHTDRAADLAGRSRTR